MRPRATRVRRLRTMAAMSVLALAACDLGPGGPTTIDGAVTGHAGLGAVVLDVTWPGVVGFAGRGSTQVYSGAVAGFPNRHRVVLVSPSGGSLPFTLTVDDRLLESPVVTIVEAVGVDDLPMSVGALRVVLER